MKKRKEDQIAVEAQLLLDRDRLEFDKAKALLEEKNENEHLLLERARLELEKRKADSADRFFNKHLGTIITATVSLAAVLISLSQVWVAYITKEKELQIAQSQKAKDIEISHLQKEKESFALQEQQTREWNLNIAKFVSENASKIFSENKEQRERIKNVMLVTFPEEVTKALFQKLERTAGSVEARKTWNYPDRSMRSGILGGVDANVLVNTPQIFSLFDWGNSNYGKKIIFTTLPGHGTVEVLSKGRVIYTPATGFTGEDLFVCKLESVFYDVDDYKFTVSIKVGTDAPSLQDWRQRTASYAVEEVDY